MSGSGLLIRAFHGLADAVLPDELVKLVQVIKHVDSAASIQVGRLENPQVVGVKMAQGHRVLPHLFVEVKWSRLGHSLVLRFFLLLRADGHLVKLFKISVR